MILRGSIHWVDLPLEKRRPAVILSPDPRNELASDIIVVPCSTRIRLGSWHVLLRKGEGGLPTESVARCESITTIPKRLLDPRPLGDRLAPSRMAAIERAVLRAIGIPLG